MPVHTEAVGLGQPRLTRERLLALLAEPGPDNPAHDPVTQYVPAPPKVQAAFAQAEKARPLIRREAIKRQALSAKSRAACAPVAPILTLAAPRERRDGRTSNPSRAGPPDDSDPDEPHLVAHRRAVDSFVSEHHLDRWDRRGDGAQLTLEELVA